jgi:endonuclease-3
MTRAEKAQKIEAILDRIHPLPPVPLEHEDPFTLLVAVVLSAQCTDERVNRVTPGLFARARTPAEMAKLRVPQILGLIKSCGLAPQKAKAIRGLSEILIQEHGGRVPDRLEALEALPGVGHKTASVVLVQAFGKPAFPVDTHVHRLADRWRLSTGKNVVQTERDLKKLFAPEKWGKIHLQMIYFGRSHCPARGHDLRECPICSWAASKARIKQEMGTATARS